MTTAEHEESLPLAKKRLYHNVLAIALANKLTRMAWAVLNKERNFEVVRTTLPSPQPA
jgi:transposase